jgi:chemotaxis protein MotB
VFLKKKYTDLEARNKNSRFIKYLYRKVKFCLEEKAGLTATVAGLKDYNQTLISSSKDMTVLTKRCTKR